LSLILVVARADADSASSDDAREVPENGQAALGWLAAGIDPSDDLTIAYTASPAEATLAAEQALADGRRAVAMVPVAAGSNGQGHSYSPRDLARLRELASETADRHPGASVAVLAGERGAAASFQDILALVHPEEVDDGELLAQAIGRAFEGETDRFGRFVRAIQRGVPRGTQIALRGSAIQGYAYKSEQPFDDRGPGTSDLDLVLLGDEAMAAWHPEAFVIPGVNTLPLSDRTIWVAPTLDPARTAAQSIARRPVAMQAMARWFLDLRSGLQGQPFVVLDA
jgi:hypothetical protein